jgi:hypothetical protein
LFDAHSHPTGGKQPGLLTRPDVHFFLVNSESVDPGQRETNPAIGTGSIAASGSDGTVVQRAIGLPELADFDISRLPRTSADGVSASADPQPANPLSRTPGAQSQTEGAVARPSLPHRSATRNRSGTRLQASSDGTLVPSANTNFGAADRLSHNTQMVGSVIEFMMPIETGGETLGQATMHIGSEDAISMRLGDLLSLVATRFDPERLKVLSASPSIDEYVSFDKLRAAGIGVRYDAANNRIVLSAD